MDVTQAAERVIRELRSHTNPERIAATLNYFPTAQENFGVSVPDLRGVVQAHSKEIRASRSATCCALPWRNGQIRDADVERWSASRDPWHRRVALASTIPLNLKSRGGTGDVPRTIAACERAIHDEHIMVHKALSWALRVLIRANPAPVEQFLELHAEDLPALVKREVKRKLTTGRKSG